MKYPLMLYCHADEILRERREHTAMELRQRKATARAEHPELYALYRDIYDHGVLLGRQQLLTGQDDADGSREAQQRRLETLAAALDTAGLGKDYFQERPTCPLCGDRGFVNGHSCSCRDAILNQLAYDWLSNTSRVKECTFDNFHLDYYSGEAADDMSKLLTSCRRYAQNFTPDSPDLLFLGPPGLGKTHLSLAIAGEVVKRGYLVLYASAPRLLDRLVDIAFNNEPEDEYRDIAYGCDLLIIDDLGTEFQTRFTKSEVYGLINNRSIENRPTIINTNLDFDELAALYSDRVLSRLVGEYKINRFAGKDIRLQKRQEEIQRRNA